VQALGSDNVKRDPLFYLTIVQKMKVGTLNPHFIYTQNAYSTIVQKMKVGGNPKPSVYLHVNAYFTRVQKMKVGTLSPQFIYM
jgi:hypothetical protein